MAIKDALNVIVEFSVMNMGKVRQSLNNVTKDVGGLRVGLRDAGTEAMAIAGGMANLAVIAGGLKKTITAAANLEFELTRVTAATAATGTQVENLRKSALALNLATEFDPSSIVSVQQSLALAGFSISEILKSTKGVLDLATGSFGKVGVAEASQVAISAMKGFGIEADQLGITIDRLLKITLMSNLQVSDLRQSLSLVAPAARASNQSISQSIAILGALRNTGLSASRSGTALANALTFVSRSKAQKELAKLGAGVKLLENDRMRPLSDIIFDVSKAMKSMDDNQRKNIANMIFGTRGLRTFNALQTMTTKVMINGTEVTLRGARAIKHLENQLKNAGGTAEKFRSIMNSTFVQQFKLLSSAVMGFVALVGESLLPIVKPPVMALKFIFGSLNKIMMQTPSILKHMFGAFLLLTSGVIAFGIAFSLLGRAQRFFIFWIDGASKGIMLLLKIMSKMPFIGGSITASLNAQSAAMATNTATTNANAAATSRLTANMQFLVDMKNRVLASNIGQSFFPAGGAATIISNLKKKLSLSSINKSIVKTAGSIYTGIESIAENSKKQVDSIIPAFGSGLKDINKNFSKGMKKTAKVMIAPFAKTLTTLLGLFSKTFALITKGIVQSMVVMGAAILANPLIGIPALLIGGFTALVLFLNSDLLGSIKNFFSSMKSQFSDFKLVFKGIREVFEKGVIRDRRLVPQDIGNQLQKRNLVNAFAESANVMNVIKTGISDANIDLKNAFQLFKKEIGIEGDIKLLAPPKAAGNVFLDIFNAIVFYGGQTIIILTKIVEVLFITAATFAAFVNDPIKYNPLKFFFPSIFSGSDKKPTSKEEEIKKQQIDAFARGMYGSVKFLENVDRLEIITNKLNNFENKRQPILSSNEQKGLAAIEPQIPIVNNHISVSIGEKVVKDAATDARTELEEDSLVRSGNTEKIPDLLSNSILNPGLSFS